VCVCVYEDVCQKIILNWIINTESVNVKTGFRWLRISTIAGFENKVTKVQFRVNREFFFTHYTSINTARITQHHDIVQSIHNILEKK